MTESIFIIFANGGWLEFYPDSQNLGSTGNNWDEAMETFRPAHSRIFCAVPASDMVEIEKAAANQAEKFNALGEP